MKKMNSKGFTLIELLVVIAIIGVLSTMAIINVRSAQEKARDSKRITAVNSMRTAIEMYIADNNTPPSIPANWPALDALIGQYIQGGLPIDPVGSSTQQFCYCVDGQDYIVAAVAESSSKTFEGDFDGLSTTFAAAECMCTDDANPAAVINCSDDGTGDVDGVNNPVFCIGTSL